METIINVLCLIVGVGVVVVSVGYLAFIHLCEKYMKDLDLD